MLKAQETAGSAVKKALICSTLWGGNSRGFGAIGENMNFGPRMTETWRILNILIDMVRRANEYLVTAKNENKLRQEEKNKLESQDQSADTAKEKTEGLKVEVEFLPVFDRIVLEVPASSVIQMLAWLDVGKNPHVRILQTTDNRSTFDTVSKEMMDKWVVFSADPTDLYISYGHQQSIPALKKSKEGDVDTQLTGHYMRWKRGLEKQPIIMTYGVVFAEEFFKEFTIIPFGMAHNLKAIITTLPISGDIQGRAWWKKCLNDVGAGVSWWHCPFPAYHPDGTRFSVPSSKLKYTEKFGLVLTNFEDMHVDARVKIPNEEQRVKRREVGKYVASGVQSAQETPIVEKKAKPAVEVKITEEEEVILKKVPKRRVAKDEVKSRVVPKKRRG